MKQLSFFIQPDPTPELLPLDEYDMVIDMISGGKDSTGQTLRIIDLGVPAHKIWLWHQAVDGKEEFHKPFFDWQVTEGYVEALARHLGLTLAWQWRAGGFYSELFKTQARSEDVYARFNGNLVHIPTTKKATVGTRRRWPAKTGDIRTRWCTGCLKIDVSRRVLNYVKRNFQRGTKFLIITGERREESPKRSKLKNVERHACHTQGYHIDHFRPVLEWKERQIWDIIEAAGIIPHPAYFLGFPRLSCRSCIFYSPNHWATLKDVDPDIISMLRSVEGALGHTIDRDFTVTELAEKGKSLLRPENARYIERALNPWQASFPITTDNWELPAGAFGSGGGAV
jgi:3'-phosphoadenosine 5'-phosphosulfate sulfotransferase (PAPS reductase)/FAD synthetase